MSFIAPRLLPHLHPFMIHRYLFWSLILYIHISWLFEIAAYIGNSFWISISTHTLTQSIQPSIHPSIHLHLLNFNQAYQPSPHISICIYPSSIVNLSVHTYTHTYTVETYHAPHHHSNTPSLSWLLSEPPSTFYSASDISPTAPSWLDSQLPDRVVPSNSATVREWLVDELSDLD